MPKIIYLIRVSLTSKGWTKAIEPIEVEEKDKVFVSHNKRISKQKMMFIDTTLLASYKIFGYFTYCEEGKQQECLTMLKKHIITKFDEVKTIVDAISKHVDSKR